MAIEDEKLQEEIDAYVERVWPQVQADIALMVSHPSVADYEKAQPGDPYGPDAHAALKCALEIAERLGLEAHDCEGHIGFADLPGRSAATIATIAHSDVVPAGVGWTQDPFTMVERDGYLIGRGVLDDKGPLVLSLYAAHFFAERVRATGESLPYTLRAIVGGDEEVGMSDVRYYLERYPEPTFLFTPDAEYPVCVGEKGLYGAFITSAEVEGGNVVRFDAGTVHNAIPGFAQVTIRSDAMPPVGEGIEVLDEGDGTYTLTARGKGGHASLPAGTRNAIGMLVEHLRAHGLLAASERPFFDLLAQLHASTDGSAIGIAASDEAFSPLTCISGTIRFNGRRFEASVDSRYVTSITGEQITERLVELAEPYGAMVCCVADEAPYLTDPDSAPVRALIGCYRQVTGSDAQPFTIGGGTYARNFAHAVSFGPEEPWVETPAWVGSVHGPDEGVSIELLRRSLKTYILAIGALMGLEYPW